MQDHGNEIKKEDIDALTIKKTESIIFDLTDNLGKKNVAKAIKILDDLKSNKEPMQKILVLLYVHFKKLYITSLSTTQNVARNLNLKPNQTFLIRKYQTQARYFKPNELRKILNEFIMLDENSKNGNIDIDVGMTAIICRYF